MSALNQPMRTPPAIPLDNLAVNTIRFLSVDMVEQAKSGHPGLPLGAAPMAYALWDRILRHSPRTPTWWNRDRFVLSAGHGSALLYALLHLTGYDLPLDQLRRFRQIGSATPGHPEYRHTPGVEATTGPLGQGFAAAIGMAMAERYLSSRYNRPGFPIVDHWTYALCSDGDLMEGISSEAASFAGSLGLGKVAFLYDDNQVSLEGPTSYSFTEDVGRRFESYGWQFHAVEDGNDLSAIESAIRRAHARPERPALIRIRTHIGYGSPKQDTKDAHGEPLGSDGARVTKQKLGWPLEPDFLIPDEALAHLRKAVDRGVAWESEWQELLQRYRAAFPDLAREFTLSMEGTLPPGWESSLPTFAPDGPPIATRDASSKAMQVIAAAVPGFLGGSADLAPSTKTTLDGLGEFSGSGPCGRNIHFGVREHAMVGLLNGLALHGGVRPFGATFLIFSDYARPAIRLSALMGLRTVLVFTHDTVGLGEDGPTHQPVEQLVSLRAIPGFTVLRPADANETIAAWQTAIQQSGPVALALTRQKLPVLASPPGRARDGVPRGAYVLAEPSSGPPAVVLIGSGSELHLCVAAQARLAERKIAARVVSMPSWELFDAQPAEYRASVLPVGLPKLAVEAGSPVGWERYVGAHGAVLGLTRFGASGPGAKVLESLGFSTERLVELAVELVEQSAR